MVFSITAVKNSFKHPLLGYNYILEGIPNVPSLNIRAAQIPGKKIEDIKIMFRGREVHFNGNIGKFEPLTIQIFEDISYTARTMIELHMQVMADNSTGFGFANPVITKNLDLFVLAPGTEHTICVYTFVNAFPVDLGASELNYDNVATPVQYSVSYCYDYWIRKDVENFSNIDDL